MPQVPDMKGAERELLATWWKEYVREMEDGYLERIERLRNGEEHPTPAIARQIRLCGALALPKATIAKNFGMTTQALMMHYGEDYEIGRFQMLKSVAANAFRIATSPFDQSAGRVAMQILDRQGGEEWTPPAQRVKVERPEDGAPVMDTRNWSPEDREALRQLCLRQLEAEKGLPDEEVGNAAV